MDGESIDLLARRVGTLGSRRAALGILAGSGLAATLGVVSHDAIAKRKKKKKKKKCTPQSRTTTCAGRCGSVVNNCRKAVNCDSCPVCQRCDSATATCQPDPALQGDACGQTGQVCQSNGSCACDAGSCESGTVCLNSTCEQCGVDGDPCCAGNTCRQAFFVCTPAGICVRCGREGEPCCANNICDSGRVCVSGTCEPCGDIGDPCCTVGNPCFAGTCSSGTCVA